MSCTPYCNAWISPLLLPVHASKTDNFALLVPSKESQVQEYNDSSVKWRIRSWGKKDQYLNRESKHMRLLEILAIQRVLFLKFVFKIHSTVLGEHLPLQRCMHNNVFARDTLYISKSSLKHAAKLQASIGFEAGLWTCFLFQNRLILYHATLESISCLLPLDEQ